MRKEKMILKDCECHDLKICPSRVVNSEKVRLYATCRYTDTAGKACGNMEEVTVDLDDYQLYLKGELVQNVWPRLSPEEREIIIGVDGYHLCPECWDKTFMGAE